MRRTDEEIKKDVVDELFWDDRIDASRIKVSVIDGIVTLSGDVPSYNDRSIARSAAWRMAGAVDVVDSLTVSYVSPPSLPSDDEIRSRVADILSWEPSIDETAITIEVEDGVVVLEGTVDAYWKKGFAENRVAGIRGIVFIDNHLAVAPTGKLSDETLARDVMSAMERDVLVDPESVTVEVNNGTVRLTGIVPTWASREAAETDAMFTNGVQDVRNDLSTAI